jgi:hypothetical protein
MKDIMEGISPLPWVFEPHNLHTGTGDGDYPFGYVSSKANGIATPLFSLAPVLRLQHAENAAYIVHACNLYPELVEALKLCQDSLHYAYCCVDQDHPEEGCIEECKKIHAILAKCKEGAE